MWTTIWWHNRLLRMTTRILHRPPQALDTIITATVCQCLLDPSVPCLRTNAPLPPKLHLHHLNLLLSRHPRLLSSSLCLLRHSHPVTHSLLSRLACPSNSPLQRLLLHLKLQFSQVVPGCMMCAWVSSNLSFKASREDRYNASEQQQQQRDDRKERDRAREAKRERDRMEKQAQEEKQRQKKAEEIQEKMAEQASLMNVEELLTDFNWKASGNAAALEKRLLGELHALEAVSRAPCKDPGTRYWQDLCIGQCACHDSIRRTSPLHCRTHW